MQSFFLYICVIDIPGKIYRIRSTIILMKMITLWFINKTPDFEREQWTLLAYLRDAENDLAKNKLEPFYSDIKRRIQDIECFLTTRTVISKLNKKERELLYDFGERDDDCTDNKEVYAIAKWGLLKLQDIRREYQHVWRHVESSFNMFYIGDKPTDKIDKGIMLIRYAGSPITEVYKFWKENEIMMKYIEYSDEDYGEIKKRLEVDHPEEVFIIAESLVAFDTITTAMPFLADMLEKKVMK